jgi:glutathione S-transferase
VLLVDGTPIFESAVILEYLAETYAPDIIPSDALARARQRMWVEISNDLLVAQYKIAVAATPADRSPAVAAARDTLARFEQVVSGRYFAGDQPGLVDFAAGPALVRFERLGRLLAIDFYAQLPKVAAWSRAIAARPAFASTLVADFDTRFAHFVRRHDEAAASLATLCP